MQDIEKNLREIGVGRIATVSGRYYGMDRDKRWDRVKLAFDAIVRAEGLKAPSAEAAIKASYAEKVTDEFVKPTIITTGNGDPVGQMRDGDVAMFFNFRADRARELTQALAYPAFKEFDRGGLKLAREMMRQQFVDKGITGI